MCCTCPRLCASVCVCACKRGKRCFRMKCKVVARRYFFLVSQRLMQWSSGFTGTLGGCVLRQCPLLRWCDTARGNLAFALVINCNISAISIWLRFIWPNSHNDGARAQIVAGCCPLPAARPQPIYVAQRATCHKHWFRCARHHDLRLRAAVTRVPNAKHCTLFVAVARAQVPGVALSSALLTLVQDETHHFSELRSL